MQHLSHTYHLEHNLGVELLMVDRITKQNGVPMTLAQLDSPAKAWYVIYLGIHGPPEQSKNFTSPTTTDTA